MVGTYYSTRWSPNYDEPKNSESEAEHASFNVDSYIDGIVQTARLSD